VGIIYFNILKIFKVKILVSLILPSFVLMVICEIKTL
jgi:hypothetical protein